MSTPFEITIGGKKYAALPPSFAFQKANKAEMRQMQSGHMSPETSQEFMAKYITHCIQRATPVLDVAELEDALDAIAIAQASMKIGQETQKQIAQAYGVDNLGEAKAGEI